MEKAQSELRSPPFGQRITLPDSLLLRRFAPALVVAGAVLALQLVTFRATPLSALPAYPAVILTFLIAVVLPGLVVQRALLGSDADVVTRVAAAPPLGMAVMAVPGFIALEAHISLDEFAVMYAVVAAAVCGLAIALAPDGQPAPAEKEGASGGRMLLLGLVLIVLAGVATTPYWASGRLSADFDDWTYMAYAREYIDTDHMNETEPFLGTDDPVNPRMRDDVWVLMQALVSDASGVPPQDVLLELMGPVLTVCAVLATFALTRTLFRNTTIALLAVAFQLGYGLIDLSSHEGFGRNLFLRISEDKMVAALMLFPIALVFLSRFVSHRSLAAYLGFVMIVLALGVVHPVPLVYLGITIGCLAALRLLADRDLRTLPPAAALLAPVAAVSVWPFIQRQLLVDAAPGLFSTEGSSITFRDEFHFVKLGSGLLMGNYHMILHPLVLLSIVLTPLVWRLARRDLGNQLVLAMTGGALLAFFFPPFATPIAKLMTPQTLWKVPWMIPVGPILAYATYQGVQRLGRVRAFRPDLSRARSVVVLGLAPALLLVLGLGAALLVQEQYAARDDGRFYTWTSGSGVLPWSDQSIFLGGIDRSFAATWRVRPYQQRLFDYMEREVPKGSVVLAEPLVLNHLMPGVLPDISPVDFGGQAGEGKRRNDVQAFVNGELSSNQLDAVVRRYNISYIVTAETDTADQVVRLYENAVWLEEFTFLELYKVVR